MASQKKSKSSSSFDKKFQPRPKAKRPGIHTKNKASRIKKSRNYRKRYRGQGK